MIHYCGYFKFRLTKKRKVKNEKLQKKLWNAFSEKNQVGFILNISYKYLIIKFV